MAKTARSRCQRSDWPGAPGGAAASVGVAQTVAETANGADEAGAKFLAQVMNVNFDGVAAGFFTPGVQTFFELTARADVLLVAEQVMQQGIFASRQDHRLAIASHPLAGRVEHHTSVLQRWRRSAAGTAYQRSQARLQLEYHL